MRPAACWPCRCEHDLLPTYFDQAFVAEIVPAAAVDVLRHRAQALYLIEAHHIYFRTLAYALKLAHALGATLELAETHSHVLIGMTPRATRDGTKHTCRRDSPNLWYTLVYCCVLCCVFLRDIWCVSVCGLTFAKIKRLSLPFHPLLPGYPSQEK